MLYIGLVVRRYAVLSYTIFIMVKNTLNTVVLYFYYVCDIFEVNTFTIQTMYFYCWVNTQLYRK
jgi:hypothetical protein